MPGTVLDTGNKDSMDRNVTCFQGAQEVRYTIQLLDCATCHKRYESSVGLQHCEGSGKLKQY